MGLLEHLLEELELRVCEGGEEEEEEKGWEEDREGEMGRHFGGIGVGVGVVGVVGRVEERRELMMRTA